MDAKRSSDKMPVHELTVRDARYARVDLKSATPPACLPPTSGRWVPTGSRARGVTGWIELFGGPGGRRMTVPGASRHADAAGNLLPLKRE